LKKSNGDNAQGVAIVAVEIRRKATASFIAEKMAKSRKAALKSSGLAPLRKLGLAELQQTSARAASW
jgi:hypothetical protein